MSYLPYKMRKVREIPLPRSIALNKLKEQEQKVKAEADKGLGKIEKSLIYDKIPDAGDIGFTLFETPTEEYICSNEGCNKPGKITLTTGKTTLWTECLHKQGEFTTWNDLKITYSKDQRMTHMCNDHQIMPDGTVVKDRFNELYNIAHSRLSKKGNNLTKEMLADHYSFLENLAEFVSYPIMPNTKEMNVTKHDVLDHVPLDQFIANSLRIGLLKIVKKIIRR
jgi:hypothetical protein